MSLYREAAQERRQGLVVATIALIIGLGGGYLLGHSSAPERSLRDSLDELRSDMQPAAGGLEILGGEYRQGVRRGEVISQGEYDGSVSNVERTEAVLAENDGELRRLDPKGTAALEATVSELRAAVARKADPGEIERLRARAAAELRAVLPAQSP